MKPALLLSLVLLATLPAAAQAQPEIEAVMVPLNAYLEGHATGSGDAMRRAFHPEAKLFWIAGDTLSILTSEQYIARMSGSPAPDEADRRRHIASIDITGDVAVAKIELDYPTVFFTDYMTLVRIGGEWKIINKSFHRASPRR